MDGRTNLVKQLQHNSEDVGMGFVHLVKEHHCAGTLLQQLGQLTPVLMSNVTRRGADKLGYLRVKKESMTKVGLCKVQ